MGGGGGGGGVGVGCGRGGIAVNPISTKVVCFSRYSLVLEH